MPGIGAGRGNRTDVGPTPLRLLSDKNRRTTVEQSERSRRGYGEDTEWLGAVLSPACGVIQKSIDPSVYGASAFKGWMGFCSRLRRDPEIQ